MTIVLIAVATTGIFLTLGASSLLSANQNNTRDNTADSTVDGTVSATNVGVFTNSACTINCTSIRAGSVIPGTSKNFTVYVKNMGTRPVSLSLATLDWIPANANGPISLTWDRDDYSLPPEAWVNATLNLSVSSSISATITTFSFNAAITGTE